MLEIFLYIFGGALIGMTASFIPGLDNSVISMLILSFGFLSGVPAAVFTVSLAIAFSLFEFIAANIFEIGDDITSLSIGNKFESENLKSIAKIVSMGALISLFLSFPLIFIFQNVYAKINATVKSSLTVILSAVILYTIFSEKNLSRKIFAAFIFVLTGIFGIMIQKSGFLPSSFLLMPVFIGLYGFSSIIARKHHERSITFPLSLKEKIRISAISFGTALFAMFIPSMKRSHVSALAFGLGKFDQNETVLLALSIISMSFLTISIVALSANSIRSNLAYDVYEIVELNFNTILLILGSFIIAATFSIAILLKLVNHLEKIVLRINEKYLKIFGFVCGSILILYFTSWKGALLAVVATLIGILSIKLRVRSAHLMGLLLVPTLLRLIGF